MKTSNTDQRRYQVPATGTGFSACASTRSFTDATAPDCTSGSASDDCIAMDIGTVIAVSIFVILMHLVLSPIVLLDVVPLLALPVIAVRISVLMITRGIVEGKRENHSRKAMNSRSVAA